MSSAEGSYHLWGRCRGAGQASAGHQSGGVGAEAVCGSTFRSSLLLNQADFRSDLTQGPITYCVQDTEDTVLLLEKVAVHREQSCAGVVGEKGRALESGKAFEKKAFGLTPNEEAFPGREEVGKRQPRQWEPHVQRPGFMKGWNAQGNRKQFSRGRTSG